MYLFQFPGRSFIPLLDVCGRATLLAPFMLPVVGYFTFNENSLLVLVQCSHLCCCTSQIEFDIIYYCMIDCRQYYHLLYSSVSSYLHVRYGSTY